MTRGRRIRTFAAASLGLLALTAPSVRPLASQRTAPPELDWFFQSAARDDRQAADALRRIADVWQDGYTSMIVDLARFMPSSRPPRTEGGSDEAVRDPDDLGDPLAVDPLAPAARRQPASFIRGRLIRFLEQRTGQRFGDDLHRWREWMWHRPYEPHPEYAAFKGRVYSRIDPRFSAFFPPAPPAAIRLDEIDWGGVAVNGIPPLDRPPHTPVADARYLKDDHIVFGVVWQGVARAYPRRILAWHELARDRLGTLELTLVYCTLCGTAMPYDSRVAGRTLTFGTSGLLYRSNKLMFDAETASLWSSLDGAPVVGPLVGSGLRLTLLPIVTTTWGEWKQQHPTTTVLSLETGFTRDYREGAAYRDYFATDALMFRVPHIDRRLRNKSEVVVFRVPRHDGSTQPAAVAVSLLRRERIFHGEVAGRRFVVLTTPGGANRVYDAGQRRFKAGPAPERLVDDRGTGWTVDETRLQALDGTAPLARIPAARAFWFGWYAQYPDTILLQ